MTEGAVLDRDLRQSLEILQAIRVLQRWLLTRPLGADQLRLSATSLSLSAGEDRVLSTTIPMP